MPVVETALSYKCKERKNRYFHILQEKKKNKWSQYYFMGLESINSKDEMYILYEVVDK